MWLRWTTQQFEKLRPGIDIIMDESSLAPKKGQSEAVQSDEMPKGIHALDLGYSGLKPQIEKCQEIFQERANVECSICSTKTPATGAGTLVCPHEGCKAVSHLQCLSSAWLKGEGDVANEALIPTSGKCPSCDTKLLWVDLVKDLSLRMRGEKEVKAIFKPKRAKKTAAAVEEESDSASEDDVLDPPLPEEDEWHELLDSSDDDVDARISKSDPPPKAARFKRLNTAQSYSEPVIQDSESDGAEIVPW